MNPDVLVVGAGPVGLTLAAELARYRVSVRLIDKLPERSDKSKALVLWSRTLELLDRGGCGAALVAAGMKATAARIMADQFEVARIGLEGTKTPHPYALMLPQSETERLLAEHLATFGVQVERPVELVRFTQNAETVAATLRHPDGREETVEAGWLIGCDGAHSTVRQSLGMGFEGDTLPSDWILADVHLDGVPLPPDELAIYWHADGMLGLFPIGPAHYRVIADAGEAHGEAHRADPTLQEIQSVLDRRGPGKIRASAPVWLSAFRINERKVADYRAGRVFLAGDAAHIHSPAGGQGMNTGMQDACNLAWKLALVCRGLAAPEPLLGSYSVERSEVGRQVLTNAGRLTTIGVLKDSLLQAIRNHVGALLFGFSAVRETVASTLAELTIGYPQSPLTRRGRYGLTGPGPGQRAPVEIGGKPVGSGDTPRFALFAPAGARAEAVIDRHHALLEPDIRPPFAPDTTWLVRPDGYVALVVGPDGWPEVEAYLQELTG